MNPAPRSPLRHRLLFAGLYLCEGAPIGFLWWALPTLLRERGAPLEAIGGLTAVLVLPWSFKFVWAPLIDLGSGRHLRAWIVGAQLLMAATLLPLLMLEPEQELSWITAALVVHALAAASQDAAIDAWAIRTTPTIELGALNGWMQAGMLLGRSAFGGGALYARRYVGDDGLVLLLSGALFLSALALLLRSRTLSVPTTPAAGPGGARNWLAALTRTGTLVGLLFAATSGAAFETVGAFAGPLLVDHGVSSDDVGLFLALPAVAATVVGALVGGRACDRIGRRTVACVAGLAIVVTVLALAGALRADEDAASLRTLLTILYFEIGVFTASTYALFMALTEPEFGATQFSAFMGATNLCESWSAKVGGVLSTRQGFPAAFTVQALVALAALPLLVFLRTDTRAAQRTGGGPAP